MFKYTVISIIFCPVLCQYAVEPGLRPDVTFDENNDRFDLSSVMMDQGRYEEGSMEYRRNLRSQKSPYYETPSKYKYLKLILNELGTKNKPTVQEEKPVSQKLVNFIRAVLKPSKMRRLFRRFNEDLEQDWAYHERMDNTNFGDVADYARNLKEYERKQRKQFTYRRLQRLVDDLHGFQSQSTRRSGADPEQDILLHYAFPVQMKIQGYLQVPSNK